MLGFNNEKAEIITPKLKTCIECKVRAARYWDSNLCERCFRILLNESIEND